MGFIEVIKTGIFEAYWKLFNPDLTVIVYTCLVVGLGLQSVIYVLPFRKKIWRWSLVLLCGLIFCVCEVLWHIYTDLRRLPIDLTYGFTACVLLGALFSIVFHNIRRYRAMKNMPDDWSV